MSKDYGAVIVQSGAQARYAEDYQKVLDTRWRPVGIVTQIPVNMTLSNAAGLYKIFDHNLGYIPAMDAPRQTDRLDPNPQSSPIGGAIFCADDTSVYIAKFASSSIRRIEGNIYLYNYAINEAYDTDYKGTSLARVFKSDFGMQIEGNNTYGTSHLGQGDNVGFAVNTNVKNISLAKVDFVTFTPTLGTTSFTINYPIPYPPLIKISRKLKTGDMFGVTFPKETWSAVSLADNGAYVNAGTLNQAIVYISGLANITSETIAYVIYRDPSEIAA